MARYTKREWKHTSANVQTNVEAFWLSLDAVVVRLEVHLEELVRVHTVLLQAFQHVLRAKVCQSRVINLHACQAFGVQGLELLLIGLGQIGKKVLVVAVSVLGVHFARCQSQVKVWCRGHGELAVTPLFLGQLASEELPLLNVRALVVLDLAVADDGHRVLETSLLQRCNRRGRKTVQIPWCILDFFKALELLEEATKVDFAVVLARADRADIGL